MATFTKVAKVHEVAPDQMKMVKVGNKEIVIVEVDGQYHAFENECSHAGAPLCGGGIDGNEVICPWHGARFDITTGAATEAPASSDLEIFPVRIVGEDIELEITP